MSYIEDKMCHIISSQWESLLRPYHIRGRPCGHAWLVCLSHCLHGDHYQSSLSGKDLIVTI